MLVGFSKEEKILFGLNIIELERSKRNIAKSPEKRFLAKIEKLKKDREEFLKTYNPKTYKQK